jgi:ATP-binding cassette subfamily F protein 3
MRINFSVEKQPGRVLCTLKNVSKSFGELVIMKDTGAEIDRGDKIALIGANGKGKSTLLRVIVGSEEFTGERIWGHNVDESFYAQHQLEALNINNNVLDEMRESRSGKTDLELRSLLGCFLFSGDDVDKKIKVLSGGEKARVALAKTIVSKANFLMLDEPTNHLDIHSVDLLIGALNNYEGSIVFVSHDRHFVSKIANKIWEIEDHKIIEFKGSYAEWEDWKERRVAAAKAAELNSKPSEPTLKNSGSKNNREQQSVKSEPVAPVASVVSNQRSPVDKEVKKEYQKNKTRFQQIEEKLAQLNKGKVELEQLMASPDGYSNKEKFHQTELSYKNITSELVTLNKEYEIVFEKVMELEEKMG